MSGGDVEPPRRGRARSPAGDRAPRAGSRPTARPRPGRTTPGSSRHASRRRSRTAPAIGTRVEPLLLHRRPDQELPAPPRNEIDVGRADDVADQLRPGEPHQLTLHRTQPERGTGASTSSLHTPPARTDDLGSARGTRGRPAVPETASTSSRGMLDPIDPAPGDDVPAQARDRGRRALRASARGSTWWSPSARSPRRCGRTGAAPGPAPPPPTAGAPEPLGALHGEQPLEVAVLVSVERDPQRALGAVAAGLACQLLDARRRTPDSDRRLSSSSVDEWPAP